MTDPRLGPDPDEVVVRVLAELREKGLLPQRQPTEPSPHQRPARGPRRCPHRNRYKRVLKGPRARQPLRSGQHPPSLRTLPKRHELPSRIAEDAPQESTVSTGPEAMPGANAR
jgi:hypothetical protein